MKKIFIIFLFIIFSSSFSLAKNNEKITVEEIENIFNWGIYRYEIWEKFSEIKWQKILSKNQEEKKESNELWEKKLDELHDTLKKI